MTEKREKTLLPSADIDSEESLEEQMLEALELFHYSFSFRDSLFVALINDEKDLEKLLTDFRVIQSSQIFLLIVTSHTTKLEGRVHELKRDGLLIEYITQDADKDVKKSKLNHIKSEYSAHDIVVYGLKSDEVCSTETLLREGLEISTLLNARKFFLVGDKYGLSINGLMQSHIPISELRQAIDNGSNLNINNQLLDLISTHLTQTSTSNSNCDVVIIDSNDGALFQEVFTHQGRGTLITKEMRGGIRKGDTGDVFIVSRLMKPYVDRGLLLPMRTEDMKREISEFKLYTINDSIVAGARMIDYGESAELAKFFSLPRFRRRGHARSLALALIDEAKMDGKKSVFSLSVSKNMWDFFLSLGFEEVEREELPEAWKSHYDFSRPSKAFKLTLS